jgi:acyl-homoserine-lactone acylase
MAATLLLALVSLQLPTAAPDSASDAVRASPPAQVAARATVPARAAEWASSPEADRGAKLAARVEIVRTDYGVPHILAEDLEAMGFGLGYVQSEDYGDVVALGLVKRRGTYARYVGRDSIDDDFDAREMHSRAVATFHRLEPATQAVYEGFAQGVNHYVRLHPEEFPAWLAPTFTGIDAHARDIQIWSRGDASRAVRELEAGSGPSGPPSGEGGRGDAGAPATEEDLAFRLDGSNAWALSGSRTTSGRAILLRNPHLAWDAGYYEAHVRVPGVVDFYGDFRVGGAFGIIGGFNAHLGWSTTNNSPTYSQLYALEAYPSLENHAVLDGQPLPLEERTTTVDYRTEDGGLAAETRSTWWTPFGPVVYRTDNRVYILKDPRDGEVRRGEQFLKMMRARSLEEWLDIMRMRAHPSSNFTYADAAGNIVLYYNARLPALPHEVTEDTAAFARSAADIWSELVPFESLPLYVNPPGGYVQQANDTPDYINLNVRMDRDTVAANLPDPRLRLRSQLSLDLVHNDRMLGLEDVVALKHSPRMLLAERVLDDLIAAAVRSGSAPELGQALDVLRAWDRTAAASSRGGVLFKLWAERYMRGTRGEEPYRVPWDELRPAETPRGIADDEEAVDALLDAVTHMRSEGLALDVPWGDVHRVIRGEVDEPVSGCEGDLGCFRTLSFEETEDGRLAANRGDGWILAVEFGDVPRAYSVLAYGQSPREDSPHYDDQAAMFAREELKVVAWTSEDIEQRAVRRYRPGEEARR